MNGCAASLENLIRDSKHALVIGVGGGGDVVGALLGAWSLTPKIAAELATVIQTVPTESSAIPVQCFRGAWGRHDIRRGERRVKLTPLTALTFFIATGKLYDTLARPAQAVRRSSSLDEAAQPAVHALGIATELDYERKYYQAALTK